VTALEELARGQKYTPDCGYREPKRTRDPCINPAFMDTHLHRIGLFRLPRYYSDGLSGYVAQGMCVNCGKVFTEISAFIPDTKEAPQVSANLSELLKLSKSMAEVVLSYQFTSPYMRKMAYRCLELVKELKEAPK